MSCNDAARGYGTFPKSRIMRECKKTIKRYDKTLGDRHEYIKGYDESTSGLQEITIRPQVPT